MPVNVGNQWDTLKVTIILFTFQFPTSLMRHQLFQQLLYDDNSVVPLLVLEINEEY